MIKFINAAGKVDFMSTQDFDTIKSYFYLREDGAYEVIPGKKAEFEALMRKTIADKLGINKV